MEKKESIAEKFLRSNKKVYLIVNEKGETECAFASVGLAIDSIGHNRKRVAGEDVVKETLTSLEWNGRDGNNYSLRIMECPLCEDVALDYMNKPKELKF